MERNEFKSRMKQYKKAREENPGLKYWEWKGIPKYDEGTEGVRDNTYVAPIEKEQVFIPATGALKLKQDVINKLTRNGQIKSGAIDTVSPEFDILTGIRAIATLPTKAEKLGREIFRSNFIPDDKITDLINSKRISDLTTFTKKIKNDSDWYVHTDLGKSNSVFAGKGKGAFIQDGQLHPGEALVFDQKPYVWWNQGKRYTNLGENKDGYQAIIIKNNNAKDLLQVKSSQLPIGQWNGKQGFVLPSEYVTHDAVNLTPNIEHYVYDGLTKTYGNVKHYAEGGKVEENEYSPVWPKTSRTERQIYFDRINPAAGFGFGNFISQGMNYYFPDGERQKAPKEDEARWAAYLGLPYDKTYAPDTKIRFTHDKNYPNRQYQGLSKDAKNEIREEIIPTLQKSYSKLGDKWIQITDEKPTDIIRNDEMYYPRQNHIGDLGKFGIREVNGSGIYEVGDKYDFPWYVPIPNRADGHELMIRDTIWSDKAKPELYIQRKAKGGEVEPDHQKYLKEVDLK